MSEYKKCTLKNFLEKKVSHALHCRPNLKLVKVANGAKDNWTFIDGTLPNGEPVLDFYHAAKHLKKAFEIVYGVKEIKASIAFSKYWSILRHDKKGINWVRHCGGDL